MDNKQKKKLYKRLYKFLIIFLLITMSFSIFVSGDALHKNQSLYVWLDVSLIIFQLLLGFILLYDAQRTKKLKNKYLLANLLYLVSFMGFIFIGIVCGLTFFDKLTIEGENIIPLILSILNNILLIVIFNIGLVISKLYQNTTITIDSVSETPNYDDELLLKKKLDELNRKLEIKKVQEQIDKVEKELDSN